ncbi:hypothetical protein TrRE_jg1409, partial [Triparma retinervis]
LGNGCEVLEKFALQFKSLNDAVSTVVEFFGMNACDGTGAVKDQSKPHMLHLSGVFVRNKQVMVRAQMQTAKEGVVLKVAVRSESDELSRMIADYIK